MSRILITGANSFIGTNFCRYSENKIVKEVSVRDIHPSEIDFSQSDVVIHLAAIVHQPRIHNSGKYFSVNRDLALGVATQAKIAGVKQFVFMSSIKVYGNFKKGDVPWNEDSPCFPSDAYGQSKFEAEQLLNKLADEKFIVSIIRTPIVYGCNVTANMLKLLNLINNIPILPFAAIENKRNYTYVENLVGFIDRIIELRAPGTFIVMDDDSLSTTDLVTQLSHFLGKKVILFRLPKILIRLGSSSLPGFFDRLYGSLELDNTKTKATLKIKPEYSTNAGLKKMVENFNANRQ